MYPANCRSQGRRVRDVRPRVLLGVERALAEASARLYQRLFSKDLRDASGEARDAAFLPRALPTRHHGRTQARTCRQRSAASASVHPQQSENLSLQTRYPAHGRPVSRLSCTCRRRGLHPLCDVRRARYQAWWPARRVGCLFRGCETLTLTLAVTRFLVSLFAIGCHASPGTSPLVVLFRRIEANRESAVRAHLTIQRAERGAVCSFSFLGPARSLFSRWLGLSSVCGTTEGGGIRLIVVFSG